MQSIDAVKQCMELMHPITRQTLKFQHLTPLLTTSQVNPASQHLVELRSFALTLFKQHLKNKEQGTVNV